MPPRLCLAFFKLHVSICFRYPTLPSFSCRQKKCKYSIIGQATNKTCYVVNDLNFGRADVEWPTLLVSFRQLVRWCCCCEGRGASDATPSHLRIKVEWTPIIKLQRPTHPDMARSVNNEAELHCQRLLAPRKNPYDYRYKVVPIKEANFLFRATTNRSKILLFQRSWSIKR